VDGTGETEDQKRDEKKIRPNLTHWHADDLNRRSVLQKPPECCDEIATRLIKAAYRAGREDLLRSGSCPECAAGDPHNEPDKPHIHLTTYGYLLYAPDHEQLDFVREIREIERRAGYAEAVAHLREDDRYRNWWTAHPDQQFGTAYWAPDGRQHLADYLETVGPDGPDVRTKPVDQSGVQPTEEQRAHE
jgi:hypothetical protein